MKILARRSSALPIESLIISPVIEVRQRNTIIYNTIIYNTIIYNTISYYITGNTLRAWAACPKTELKVSWAKKKATISYSRSLSQIILARHYRQQANYPQTLADAVKARLYFAPLDFDVKQYVGVILRLFEISNTRLRTSQSQLLDKIEWSAPATPWPRVGNLELGFASTPTGIFFFNNACIVWHIPMIRNVPDSFVIAISKISSFESLICFYKSKFKVKDLNFTTKP